MILASQIFDVYAPNKITQALIKLRFCLFIFYYKLLNANANTDDDMGIQSNTAYFKTEMLRVKRVTITICVRPS